MAFEAITTQEQLDGVIKDRLEREREKFAGFEDYKKKAEEYDELKKKTDGYEAAVADYKKAVDGDDKTPGYKKQLEELQGKVKGYETSSVKMRIAHENGIPYELAGRLSGDNEEAIKKDAESMSKFLKASGRRVPLASTEPEDGVDGKRAAIKKMLAGMKGE